VSGGGKGDPALAVVAAGLALAAVAVGNGAIDRAARPAVGDAPAGLTAAQQTKLEKVAAASLFGQFRSSMADFLYLKVDKYLHKGVDLRGLTPQEQKAADADAVRTKDSDVAQGFQQHEEETTVVPSAARDWRGVVGDLERATQPSGDMGNHEHADPKEALPLFRLMTWSNPHFIPGYTVGAGLMSRSEPEEALAFLREGEKNNPESVEIQFALGEMFMARRKQPASAEPHLRRALELSRARDLATMTEDEQEAYEGTYRFLVILLRDAGRHPEAAAIARECLAVFPENTTARNYLAGFRPG